MHATATDCFCRALVVGSGPLGIFGLLPLLTAEGPLGIFGLLPLLTAEGPLCFFGLLPLLTAEGKNLESDALKSEGWLFEYRSPAFALRPGPTTIRGVSSASAGTSRCPAWSPAAKVCLQ